MMVGMTLTLASVAPPITQWPDGSYRIGGTRIRLEMFIWVYTHEHLTAEQLVYEWPTITLERAHGVLAYYFANKDAVDAYVETQRVEEERIVEEDKRLHALPEHLRRRFEELGKQQG